MEVSCSSPLRLVRQSQPCLAVALLPVSAFSFSLYLGFYPFFCIFCLIFEALVFSSNNLEMYVSLCLDFLGDIVCNGLVCLFGFRLGIV